MQSVIRYALGVGAMFVLSGAALAQYELETSLVLESDSGTEFVDLARNSDRLAIAIEGALHQGLALVRSNDGSWAPDEPASELFVNLALTGGITFEVEDFESFAIAAQRTEILIGSPSSRVAGQSSAGSVARFARQPDGAWTNIEFLTTPTPDSVDAFGASVAYSGPWIAVGSPNQDSASGSATGAVHVFRTAPGQPSTPWQILAPPAPAGQSDFGTQVAISGGTLVVTAPKSVVVPGSLARGKVFIYELAPDDAWELVAELQSTDPDTYRRFASSADIDGDLIAVGERAIGPGGPGRAETFRRSTVGVWEPAHPIAPEYVYEPFEFGRSIAIEDSTVAIGARMPGPNATGVVSVHTMRSDGTWKLERLLTGSKAAPEDLSDNEYSVGTNVLLENGEVLTGDSYVLAFEPAYLARGSLGVSAANGGSQALVLHGGPERAFHAFVLLGSMSGLGPPTPIPGTPFVTDLVLDAYTDALVGGLGAGVIDPFFGVLDETGRASSIFALPAGTDPAFIGSTLHHAYVTFQLVPFVEPALVSNSVSVEIVQ
jgi:hypothetical protein